MLKTEVPLEKLPEPFAMCMPSLPDPKPLPSVLSMSGEGSTDRGLTFLPPQPVQDQAPSSRDIPTPWTSGNSRYFTFSRPLRGRHDRLNDIKGYELTVPLTTPDPCLLCPTNLTSSHNNILP